MRHVVVLLALVSAAATSPLRDPLLAQSADTTPRPPRPRTAEEIRIATRDSILDSLWPVKGPAPLPGSILPERRIVAYYGNPLSVRMGVLGEYPKDEMLKMLDAEVRAWEEGDPLTPVQPALHLIAVVAQGAPGRDGKYRLRMTDELIERVAAWAEERNALVFLDVQVGLSTLQAELPRLANFLARPNFHLGIDPEFAMKNGGIPGKRIGTYDAEDINYATEFLQTLVKNHKLPPKVLVVHRFTKNGVTNANKIVLRPEVQVVMHMDGFGAPSLKKNSFRQFVKAEPVQFAGWKQFYKAKNDSPRTSIAEILRLNPKVLYIQYQ
ncbi:MAG: hypothetical protein ACKVS7_13435 [Gemmatimonadaceae bacterium]